MNKRWWGLGLVAGLLVLLTRPALFSLPKDYRLELTITTDRQEEYVLVVELDEREYKRLENNPSTEILTYLTMARREYAVKMGYRPEIYGPDNYKMVSIRKSSFVVREIDSGRIVFRKG